MSSGKQGLVERTNECIKLMIAAKRINSNEKTWYLWLPEIQCEYFFVIVAEYASKFILSYVIRFSFMTFDFFCP